ncbi:MAG: dephospho-CoA kinase [Bacteroidales bacterium]|nr:dephospho-CoA kinase [Bacteroidales bacterium]
MIKVGLTGGIGSGKTTVAKIFEAIKVPVFYADIVSKEIINKDKFVVAQIKQYFGEIYNNNQIDKQRFANIIFNNPEKLKLVNSIIHPAVRNSYKKWVQLNNTQPYTLMEAAILFESGTYKILDKTITVFAPEKLKIKRVCKRDNTTPEKVIVRINNQISDNEKVNIADYVIYNDDIQMLIPQVIKIHNQLTILFSEHKL